MTIAILYSLPTRRAKTSMYLITEEDTVVSAQDIAAALRKKGATPVLVGLSEDTIIRTIQTIRADLIINLIDWTGADLPLSLQAMRELERRGIPFAGADVQNYALVDKLKMKEALDGAHLPTARWQVFRSGNERVRPDFSYPVLVKLAHEHCSIGIEKSSFVKSSTELVRVVSDRLKRFSQDVYAEEFIAGREFQITVLERSGTPVMLPPAEIVYDKKYGVPEFLTFSERWNEKDPAYERSGTILAKLTKKQHALFEEVSHKTFRKLGFRDFTRIDARLRGTQSLLILEANPNPGLDSDSEYSMTISANAVGMTFADFMWEIVLSALGRKKKFRRRDGK